MKLEKRVITEPAEFKLATEFLDRSIINKGFPKNIIPLTSHSESSSGYSTFMEEFLLGDPSIVVLRESIRDIRFSEFEDKYTLVGNKNELNRFYALIERGEEGLAKKTEAEQVDGFLRDLPLKPSRLDSEFQLEYLPLASEVKIGDYIKIKFSDRRIPGTPWNDPEPWINKGPDLWHFNELIRRASGGQLSQFRKNGFDSNVQFGEYCLPINFHELQTMKTALLDVYVQHGEEWNIPLGAHAKLKRKYNEISPSFEPINLGEINMSVRLANCLNNYDIGELHQLSTFTERDLLRQRNMGKKSLKEIGGILEDRGLKLNTPIYSQRDK
jgi:hypothetical protein